MKSARSSCTSNSSSRAVRIGADPSGIWDIWNGTIDEVRIWKRALSAEEINASYKGSPLFLNISAQERNYSYYGFATDRAGNSNKTETRIITFDTIFPQINYSGGTATDGASLSQKKTL